MTNGKVPAEEVTQRPVLEALKSYIETGAPLNMTLDEFDSSHPKDLIRELGKNGLKFADQEAKDRYLRICQFTDRRTDYEAMGPARAAGSDSGISGRDRTISTRTQRWVD